LSRINDTAIPATTRLYSSWDGYTWTVATYRIFSFFPPDLPNGWAARFSGDTIIAFGFNTGDSTGTTVKAPQGGRNGFFRIRNSVASGNVDQGANALIANSKPALWIAGDSEERHRRRKPHREASWTARPGPRRKVCRLWVHRPVAALPAGDLSVGETIPETSS
jgi:hypothetical protein